MPSFVGFYGLSIERSFALSTVQCLMLPLAVVLPRSTMMLHVGTIVLIGYVTRGSIDDIWPLPVPNLLVLIALLVILGLREEWVVSVGAWWLSFLGMTLVVALNADDFDNSPSEWGEDVLISVTVTLIALAISVSLGQRGRVREVLAKAKRDVELEQARRATVEERAHCP